jgi:hypothetical protein
MSEDGPREYDRIYEDVVNHRFRRRAGYSRNQQMITRFVAQLEYKPDDEWQPIVRFDYDPAGDHGHDVTTEGVHMDVYRDGQKERVEEVFPPMSARDAFSFGEEHLKQHAEQYINRFEQWHGIKNP